MWQDSNGGEVEIKWDEIGTSRSRPYSKNKNKTWPTHEYRGRGTLCLRGVPHDSLIIFAHLHVLASTSKVHANRHRQTYIRRYPLPPPQSWFIFESRTRECKIKIHHNYTYNAQIAGPLSQPLNRNHVECANVHKFK